ncbi:protein translocase subunit SecD [Micavibrio aeruginosavorus]|uniref:protein translocase subunit SecD n=1 Tax=Micavibrio aeruginosavorus TaxID=349221 RepID=UPI003F4AA0EE
MIYIETWKKVLIVLVCVLSLIYSAPNLLDQATREKMAQTMPGFVPHKAVNLGLDLQGGSHLLLKVELGDVLTQRADTLAQSLRPELREQKIGYTRIAPVPNGVRVSLRADADVDKVKSIMRKLDSDLTVLVSEDGKTVEGTLSEDAMKKIADATLGQSIEIVRRRVDESGTREPVIARQGDDRIVLQLPGVDDPQRIKEILGKTAKLSFHMVDTGSSGTSLAEGGGTRTLPSADMPGVDITIFRQPILTGDMLTNAQPSFQQQGPAVSFNLNSVGARRFCDVTSKQENIGQPFAIVLDDVVISAPSIREPICGGAAQISGSFTVEETNDLALLLRAGALPAPLSVMEERTVGPSLGADSVEAGKTACLMALLFVIILSMTVYGLFGVFASVALLLNMVMIMAIMSVLQATLTLPGIAGIVLTIGLAVDANVLVFERMKEELRSGRSINSALDTAYRRALTTITDSNLTSLIAALVLFSFGTGPIKGFAVTMTIGIITSYFCSLALTRAMIVTWLHRVKPKSIPV